MFSIMSPRFDLSLRKGFFPNGLKVAKFNPISKSGETAEICNYRPMSVLPLFSKIIERIMCNHGTIIWTFVF